MHLCRNRAQRDRKPVSIYTHLYGTYQIFAKNFNIRQLKFDLLTQLTLDHKCVGLDVLAGSCNCDHVERKFALQLQIHSRLFPESLIM